MRVRVLQARLLDCVFVVCPGWGRGAVFSIRHVEKTLAAPEEKQAKVRHKTN